MKIAICDSDMAFSNKFKHVLYSYSNRHNLEFFVETYNSGEQLLKSKNNYPLIFIDYSLPGIDGLETAKRIRKQNNNTKIIFLTNNTEIVFETFQVRAYRFLKKPLHISELYSSLDTLFFSTHGHYHLCINDGISTYCIDTAEITYLEADNKYCRVHLCDNVICCKKTMARVFEALPKMHFLKINRSFIVNLSYINKYNSESVFLKNGKDLHITRTYYKNFKEDYTKYLSPIII